METYLDSNGKVVVNYVYDAWGNHAVLDGNGNNVTGGIGVMNPFRYRGYYFDTETELYYLQTRYYDPEIGRFINIDNHVFLAPSNLNGLNLYVYCLNNPIMGYDPTGTWNWGKVRDWFSTITGLFNPISKLTMLGAVIVAACQGRGDEIIEDWNNGCFNPFNMDEEVALNSKVFSFYKGESVIRQAIPDTTSCQIFGNIFLNGSEKFDAEGIQTLNHEFGHGIQERLFPDYLLHIATPSLITYFADVSSSPYYSMPWERTADYFGGVDRGIYKEGSLGWAFTENMLGVFVIPFYFLFGY